MLSGPMRSGGIIVYMTPQYIKGVVSGEPLILNLRELPLGGGRVGIAQ